MGEGHHIDNCGTMFLDETDSETVRRHFLGQKQHLELMQKDELRTQTGTELVNSIDFSEIYVYMHPGRQESKYGELVSWYLNQTKDKCIIPPAWLWECLEFLRRKARSLKNHFAQESTVKFLSSVTTDMNVDELQQKYHQLGGADFFIQAMSAEGLRSSFEQPVERLTKLFSERKLVGAENFLDVRNVHIDPTLYKTILELLKMARSRSEDELANKIDAHGYAFAYTSNQTSAEEHYFTVVTHSKNPFEIFRLFPWKDDPLHQNLSLVRHPVYVMNKARVDAKFIDIKKRLDYIRDGIDLIDVLVEDVGDVKVLENRLRAASRIEEKAMIRKVLQPKINRFYKYDTCYWEDIFLPVQREVNGALSPPPEMSPKQAYIKFLEQRGFDLGVEEAYGRIRDVIRRLYKEAQKATEEFDPSDIDPTLGETKKWLETDDDNSR